MGWVCRRRARDIGAPPSQIGDFAPAFPGVATSPPVLVPASLSDWSRPGGCDAVSQPGVDLDFPDDWRCWTVLIGLLSECVSSLEIPFCLRPNS